MEGSSEVTGVQSYLEVFLVQFQNPCLGFGLNGLTAFGPLYRLTSTTTLLEKTSPEGEVTIFSPDIFQQAMITNSHDKNTYNG